MLLITQKSKSAKRQKTTMFDTTRNIVLASFLFMALGVAATHATSTGTADIFTDTDKSGGMKATDAQSHFDTVQLNDSTKNTETAGSKEHLDANAPDTSNSEATAHHKFSKNLSKITKARSKKQSADNDNNSYNLKNFSATELEENLSAWLGFGITMGKDGDDDDGLDHTDGMHLLVGAGVDTRFTDKIAAGIVLGYGHASMDINGALAKKKKAENSLNNFALAAYANFDVEVISIDAMAFGAYGSHNIKELDFDLGDYKAYAFGLAADVDYGLPIEQVNLKVGAQLGFDMVNVGIHANKYNKDKDLKLKDDGKILDGVTPKHSSYVFTLNPYISIKDSIALDNDMKFSYKAAVGYQFVSTSGDISFSLEEIGLSGTDIALKYREMNKHSAVIDLGATIKMQKQISLGLDVNLEIGKSFFYGGAIIARYSF